MSLFILIFGVNNASLTSLNFALSLIYDFLIQVAAMVQLQRVFDFALKFDGLLLYILEVFDQLLKVDMVALDLVNDSIHGCCFDNFHSREEWKQADITLINCRLCVVPHTDGLFRGLLTLFIYEN